MNRSYKHNSSYLISTMRLLLFSLILLTIACRRPSKQLVAMLTPVNQTEISDYSQYLKAGDELVAKGNEPFWSLTVNSSRGIMRFKSLNGDSISIPAPERQTDSDGTFRYTAQTESGRMNIVFRPDSCVDSMSGQRFDYRVNVDVRGKNYVGCGVSLRQVALLQDIWVLTDLQGVAVKAPGDGRELPRLEISLTEGRVTGTTGCNRLNGNVKADSRQILFGPLVTTRRACVGEGAELESKFISELTLPFTYQIANMKLILLRAGKPVMTFKKVD